MRRERIRRLSLCLLGAVLASSALRAFYLFSADLTDLTKSSELVVLGEVSEVKGLGGRWSAKIEIEEVFKGPATKSVTLWVMCGAEEFMSASVGERLVLFLGQGIGGPDVKMVYGRGQARIEVLSTERGRLARVPAAIRLPSTVTPLKEPNMTDGSVLLKLDDLRALIQSAVTPPGSSGLPALPNNPIKLTAHPVTQLACASCAPVWSAAYRVR